MDITKGKKTMPAGAGGLKMQERRVIELSPAPKPCRAAYFSSAAKEPGAGAAGIAGAGAAGFAAGFLAAAFFFAGFLAAAFFFAGFLAAAFFAGFLAAAFFAGFLAAAFFAGFLAAAFFAGFLATAFFAGFLAAAFFAGFLAAAFFAGFLAAGFALLFLGVAMLDSFLKLANSRFGSSYSQTLHSLSVRPSNQPCCCSPIISQKGNYCALGALILFHKFCDAQEFDLILQQNFFIALLQPMIIQVSSRYQMSPYGKQTLMFTFRIL